jgi:hypothetical protein
MKFASAGLKRHPMLIPISALAASLSAAAGCAPAGANFCFRGNSHRAAYYEVSGTHSEGTYIANVRLQRNGDWFLLSGGAPQGREPQRIAIRVDDQGTLHGSRLDGSEVHCQLDRLNACDLPISGFLATAVVEAAVRRGQIPAVIGVRSFGARHVACLSAESLRSSFGDKPVLDPCVDTETGAVLAFRHRRSGRFEGPSLDPESVQVHVGARTANRPFKQETP